MKSSRCRRLQPEIWQQVFHKLAITYVIRCKAVCKEWRSLISHPFFKSNYNPSTIPNYPQRMMMISKTRNASHFLSAASTYEINDSGIKLLSCRYNPFPRIDNGGYFTFLGSWNGLVALYRQPRHLVLFNPITKEEKTVSTPFDNIVFPEGPGGLFHDPARDEYKAFFYSKIYLINVHTQNYLYAFYVVSFKDGSWKVVTESRMDWPRFRNPTMIDGVPHWIWPDKTVAYFDGEGFRFLKVSLPGVRASWGYSLLGLGALDGKLVAGVCSPYVPKELEVWGLNYDYIHDHKEENNCANPGCNSWSKLFVIDVFGYYWDSCIILGWTKKKGKVLIVVNEEKLMVYDIKSGISWPLRGGEKLARPWFDVITYVPSFVSPL